MASGRPMESVPRNRVGPPRVRVASVDGIGQALVMYAEPFELAC